MLVTRFFLHMKSPAVVLFDLSIEENVTVMMFLTSASSQREQKWHNYLLKTPEPLSKF